MAQPLTWREVSAPDFSTAMRGQAQASTLLQQALGNASSGLAQFDNTQTDIVNQAAQAKLLKYQDPAQLQAALKSGALFAGLDPSRIRPATMNDANNRVGNLIGTAARTEDLTQGIYNNQTLNAETVRKLDARLPFAAAQADASGVALPEAFKYLSVEDQSKYMASLQATEQAAYAKGKGRLADKETEEVNLLAKQLTDSGAQNIGWRKAGEKLSPNARAKLEAAYVASTGGKKLFGINADLNDNDPDQLISNAANGTPSVGGKATTYNTIYGDSSGAANVAAGTMGDKMTLGTKQIASTKGTLPGTQLGTSAAGRYQVTNTTLEEVAPKLFGDSWRNMPYDETVQEKIGAELYSRRNAKKSNMTDEWAGLKKIQGADAAGVWDGIPWEVASDVIAQYESGGDKVLGANPSMADVRKYAQSKAKQQPAVPGVENFRPGGTTVAGVPTQVPGQWGPAPVQTKTEADVSFMTKMFGTGMANAATLPIAGAVEPAAKASSLISGTVNSATKAKAVVDSVVTANTNKLAADDPSNITKYFDNFKSEKGADSDYIDQLMNISSLKSGNADRDAVETMYNRIKEETGKPGRVVAAAIQHMVRTDGWTKGTNWFFDPWTDKGSTDTLGGNVAIPEKKLKNMIQFLKKNEIEKMVSVNKDKTEIETKLSNVQASWDKEEDALIAMQSRVDAGVPGAAASLKIIEDRVKRREARFNSLMKAAGGDTSIPDKVRK